MNEIDKANLTDQTKPRSKEISKVEHYFNLGINQKKLCSKKLTKYFAAFDYIDKILIVLSATSGGDFYYFFCNCCWSSSLNSRGKFYSNFSIATGIIKKLLSITRNKKKKHDKILVG